MVNPMWDHPPTDLCVQVLDVECGDGWLDPLLYIFKYVTIHYSQGGLVCETFQVGYVYTLKIRSGTQARRRAIRSSTSSSPTQ